MLGSRKWGYRVILALANVYLLTLLTAALQETPPGESFWTFMALNFPALAALVYVVYKNERRYDKMVDSLNEIARNLTKILTIIETTGLVRKDNQE